MKKSANYNTKQLKGIQMKHLFIPYELAVIAKEKGFDEPCFRCYDSEGYLTTEHDSYVSVNGKKYNGDKRLIYSAPLYQQICDWFREKHKIIITICPDKTIEDGTMFNAIIDLDALDYDHDLIRQIGRYRDSIIHEKDYYEALNKAITEALKLI